MIKVYIASPYTIGDKKHNVKLQIDCANELINLEFAPFAPLLSHYLPPQPYEKWLELDLEWLKCCDCLLRLEGESAGADKEVDAAISANKPVVYSIDELKGLYNL